MSRHNGTFKYKTIQEPERDPTTGFLTPATGTSEWVQGCECQIDKSIPAKQIMGVDGQVHAYTYDVFIPKHFKGVLSVGTHIQLISESGVVDEFTIKGIDDLNRRYIEIWG